MQNRPELHHIQRGILLSLATYSPQRFTELQPPRIPNNTFSYHLKRLVDTGYITSTNKGYIATRKALKLIGFGASQRQQSTSPTVITMLYVTNDEGEVLLLNRNKRPFQGWYGLPSGTVHVGESIDEAAKRELREKANIASTHTLKKLGVLDFQYREEETDDIFVHALGFLYSYHVSGSGNELNNMTTEYGQLSWSKLGRQYILPEVQAVRDIAEAGVFIHESIQFIEPAHTPVLHLFSSESNPILLSMRARELAK